MAPTLFAAIVCLAGLLTTCVGSIYWQVCFCLFGAASAVHLTALGGATVTPGPLFLPFLLARVWAENHGNGYVRRVPVAGLWLGLAVLCGCLTAFFVPRALEGELEILTVDLNSGVSGAALYPLHPVSGNITQSGYAIGSLLAFLAFRALLERPGRMRHFRDAILLLSALDVGAALLNLAEFRLGLPSVLNFFRDAYAVFSAYEGEGGLMRIHGTFSETSAFCAFSLPLLAFCFQLWMHRVRTLWSGALAAALLILLLLSTSTTAYVGLGIYAALLTFSLTHQSYLRGTVPRLGLLVAAALLTAVIVGAFFVLETSIGQRLTDYINLTVFNKLDSDSGRIRTALNAQAWHNFTDTYGLGVGLGSARASSLALVLLSNLGAAGTLCFCLFIRSALKGPKRPAPFNVTREAARQALHAALTAALVSAGVYDLGLMFYAFAAASSIPSEQSMQFTSMTTARRFIGEAAEDFQSIAR